MTNQFKVGVLYCKDGQSTEEEMYNNRKLTLFYFYLETLYFTASQPEFTYKKGKVNQFSSRKKRKKNVSLY